MLIPLCFLAAFGVALSPPTPADPIAVRVDQHFADHWRKTVVTPAPVCDDATFLRRASLDLLGRIPTVAEVRAFLADSSPHKRTVLVDRLLASPLHAQHMASVWRRVWLPQSDAPAFARLAPAFEDWIAERLTARVPYDEMVRELLTMPPGSLDGGGESVSPRGFRVANEYKPENLAASAARAFLGVNLDCAQCHNHPFAKWTRDQFWETAAFFARPITTPTGIRLELPIGETARMANPRLLTATPLNWPQEIRAETGPTLFAAWVTASDNPFFARNAVNRLWAQLLGTGLIEPLDDLGGDAPQDYDPVLEDLARAFRDGGYDFAQLTRGIVLSRVYQQASEPATEVPTSEGVAFSRAMVRGLTGEQLYDSLRVAGGHPLPESRVKNPTRQQFISLFQSERAGTAQRSVIQALTLMNGRVVMENVQPGLSPIVQAVSAPFFQEAERIDMLFLSALGRLPTEPERQFLVAHLEAGAARGERTSALADIFWALLNTAEFSTNH
ncbi:MAG: DUF1549 and DUF1553 domain-containing protein [Bacteroidales bacterium]|nr:DUF1549 and DUF1553 domain-containing protein [Bacteroidales bacterium]